MKHVDRQRLTRELCDRIVQKYGEEIIIGGVFGSTARGNDTEWSDVEMLFITQDHCEFHEQHIVYKDTVVGCYTKTRSKLEEYLTNPRIDGDTSWPYLMGVLSVLKVLHGDGSQVDVWLHLGRSVPVTKFKKALERHLPEILIEAYGRIFSCNKRDNDDDWYCAVLEVLFEIKDALCLLNQSWVTHDYYQGMVDSFKFSKLPEGYKEIVPKLWHVQELGTAMKLARKLVDNFWQLLDEQGIARRSYQNVSDIPV